MEIGQTWCIASKEILAHPQGFESLTGFSRWLEHDRLLQAMIFERTGRRCLD